jgi:hypothetical protein
VYADKSNSVGVDGSKAGVVEILHDGYAVRERTVTPNNALSGATTRIGSPVRSSNMSATGTQTQTMKDSRTTKYTPDGNLGDKDNLGYGSKRASLSSAGASELDSINAANIWNKASQKLPWPGMGVVVFRMHVYERCVGICVCVCMYIYIYIYIYIYRYI